MKVSGVFAAALLLAMSSLTPAADETPAGNDVASLNRARTGPTIEIVDLIGRVAKRTGKQFVLDPRVVGPVPTSGLDVERVDYPRLLAVLRVNQYAAYEAGGLVSVMPDANARQWPIPVSTSVGTQTLDDEIVNVIVQVKNVCAAQLVPVLRPMLPQAAHLAALPTSSLIISDRAANVRKIVDMVDRLDKQAAANKQSCEPPAKSS